MYLYDDGQAQRIGMRQMANCLSTSCFNSSIFRQKRKIPKTELELFNVRRKWSYMALIFFKGLKRNENI
jgi:hypothetical protein